MLMKRPANTCDKQGYAVNNMLSTHQWSTNGLVWCSDVSSSQLREEYTGGEILYETSQAEIKHGAHASAERETASRHFHGWPAALFRIWIVNARKVGYSKIKIHSGFHQIEEHCLEKLRINTASLKHLNARYAASLASPGPCLASGPPHAQPLGASSCCASALTHTRP